MTGSLAGTPLLSSAMLASRIGPAGQANKGWGSSIPN